MSLRNCMKFLSGRRLFCAPLNCKSNSSDLSSKIKVVSSQYICVRYAGSKTDDVVPIYKGAISTRIRFVKIFSLSTSAIGISMQPMLVEKYLEHGSDFGLTVFCGLIVQFFTFGTPFLFHYIVKRYITSISYDSTNDTYTATMYNFLAIEQTLRFKPEDVVVPDITSIFSTVVIKNRPFFLEMVNFSDIHHYKRIMGYDKPIDFKLMDKNSKE